ncbi:MAG: SGNH/GDSL hydrolase family protein [Chthoniobacterales bacterium]|nr:SGNH/GDSL hydrolase family protein [Chthoniobacterales bacterium]
MSIRRTALGGLMALATAGALRAELPDVRGAAVPVRVMVIGDSLSVGPFGKTLEAALKRRYGPRGYCLFASCGSSPEDWLRGEPVFTTNCGYRQSTPGGSLAYEYSNGRRPRPVKTPKLPEILRRYQPEVVIVQLGTNWMTKLAAESHPDGAAYRRIIREFVRQLRGGRGTPPHVVWVMPPSSSKYPARVHEEVEDWIADSGRSLGFGTINSRRITGPYRKGGTGGDGVHFSDDAGAAWARGVVDALSRSR